MSTACKTLGCLCQLGSLSATARFPNPKARCNAAAYIALRMVFRIEFFFNFFPITERSPRLAVFTSTSAMVHLGPAKTRACHFTYFHSLLLSKSRKMANQHCCFVIQGPTQRCPYYKWHDRKCPGNTSLQHVSFIRFRTKRNNHNHNTRVFAAYTLAATLTTQLQHTTTSLPLISSKPGTPVLLPFEHRTGSLPADH